MAVAARLLRGGFPALWVLLGWVVLPGCNQEPILARSQRGGVTVIQGMVGPRGASLRNGEVEIEFPPGALPADTPVTVKKVPRGGSGVASVKTTALAMTEGCGKMRPQGDFLYTFEPTTLVFAKKVRVTISALGNPDGPTALTMAGASTNCNGYATSGKKATVYLFDFADSLDIQTVVPTMATSYLVSCDGVSCTATNAKGEVTTCATISGEIGLYSCQGPLGFPSTASAFSIEELRALMPAVAIGQGASCDGAPQPVCGDGTRNQSTEQCDGSDLGGATCTSVLGAGYQGALSCDADCQLDSSGCQ